MPVRDNTERLPVAGLSVFATSAATITGGPGITDLTPVYWPPFRDQVLQISAPSLTGQIVTAIPKVLEQPGFTVKLILGPTGSGGSVAIYTQMNESLGIGTLYGSTTLSYWVTLIYDGAVWRLKETNALVAVSGTAAGSFVTNAPDATITQQFYLG